MKPAKGKIMMSRLYINFTNKKQYYTSEYILIPNYVQEEAAVWDSTIGCKHSSNLKIGSACKRNKTNRGRAWANQPIWLAKMGKVAKVAKMATGPPKNHFTLTHNPHDIILPTVSGDRSGFKMAQII